MNSFEILKDVNEDIRDAISEYGVVVDTGMVGYADDIRQIKKVDQQLSFPKNTKFAYSKFTSFPEIDISEWDDCSNMFYNCKNLISIDNLDTSNVTNMDYMFQGCSDGEFTDDGYVMWGLKKIPLLDCGRVRSVMMMLYSCSNITDLGGFKDLGKQSDFKVSAMRLYDCYKLTYESIMNVINNLYDRKKAGYSVLEFRIAPETMSLLSEEDIAIATNKGWILEPFD